MDYRLKTQPRHLVVNHRHRVCNHEKFVPQDAFDLPGNSLFLDTIFNEIEYLGSITRWNTRICARVDGAMLRKIRGESLALQGGDEADKQYPTADDGTDSSMVPENSSIGGCSCRRCMAICFHPFSIQIWSDYRPVVFRRRLGYGDRMIRALIRGIVENITVAERLLRSRLADAY